MKKIVSLILITIFLSTNSVCAKLVKVKALSDFTTENPPKIWKIEIVDEFETKNGIICYSGSVITGKIQNVKSPKRLKRNAVFTFIPTELYDSISKKTIQIKENIKGKYSTMSDITVGSVVKTGAVAAGSHFINGFIGPSFALVEGAVKNEEGNRAKSAAKSVYESTPVSYIEKGKELEIKENQIFVMNFKLSEDDEDDEYETDLESVNK